jgi:hypothetical protein
MPFDCSRYGAANAAAFDIGNHFNEWQDLEEQAANNFAHYPSQQQKLHFLSAYSAATGGGQRQQEELEAKVDLYMIVAHLLWASWGLYQARTSTIDFDYRSLAVNRWGSCSSFVVGQLMETQVFAGPRSEGGSSAKVLLLEPKTAAINTVVNKLVHMTHTLHALPHVMSRSSTGTFAARGCGFLEAAGASAGPVVDGLQRALRRWVVCESLQALQHSERV